MNASHVTGGGVGAVLASVAVGLLHRFTSLTVSAADAALLGSAALSAGVALGHGIGRYGLKGLVTRLWGGEPKLVPPTPTQAGQP